MISLIKKYHLVIFNLIIFFVFIVVFSMRPIEIGGEKTRLYPILGEFMLFMLYVGIPLIGFFIRLYFIHNKWIWIPIIVCEFCFAWPCGYAIAWWANLRNEIYMGIFMTAPMFTVPGIIVSLLIYYTLMPFIKNKNEIQRIALVSLRTLNYTFLMIFIVLYIMGI